METQENNKDKDWREEVSDAPNVLKIEDGKTVKFVFMDEGLPRTHKDYGDSILFQIQMNEEDMGWYVNSKNFDLLNQIKELGKIKGMPVEVTRQGAKKSDTRYNIQKITDFEPIPEETVTGQ